MYMEGVGGGLRPFCRVNLLNFEVAYLYLVFEPHLLPAYLRGQRASERIYLGFRN